MARTVGSEGARTEAAIREAAIALIAQHGFEGVSMRRLAEEVGVQAGALYRYFPTKQDLLVSMMRDHLERLMQSWAKARPAGGSAVEALEAFARFHVRYHLSRRDEVFINYMELRSLTPDNHGEISRLRRAYEEELRAILRRGCAEAAFDVGDVAVTAMALIALLTGLTTWRKEGGRLSAEQIEAEYVLLVRRSVGMRCEEKTGMRCDAS